ncbi:MAG: hypothetical protein M9892_09025 [Bacteroidetes bacterium]|nr:hypothetical protein [Bacteroidota bacterium]
MRRQKEIKQLKNNYIYTKFHNKMKTKILLILLAISSFAANAQNDNPYAIFGHKTTVNYVDNDLFTLENPDSTSLTKKIVYNAEERKLYLYGDDNILLHSYSVLPTNQFIWLSTDPAARKYPSMSPYSAFGGNPILITDPNGDTLRISNDASSASLSDLQSLIPKDYQSMIKVVNSNMIVFQGYENLPENIKKYEGVSLLNNMINSQKNYQYTAGNTIIGFDPVTNSTGQIVYDPTGTDANNANGAIQNFSKTPYWPDNPNAQYQPGDGFDGSVRIPQGNFTVENVFTNTAVSVDRPTVVFHELKENFLRTETNQTQQSGYSYAPNGGMYYSNNSSSLTGGAHQAAGNVGKTNSKQLGISTNGASGTGQNWQFTPTK